MIFNWLQRKLGILSVLNQVATIQTAISVLNTVVNGKQADKQQLEDAVRQAVADAAEKAAADAIAKVLKTKKG